MGPYRFVAARSRRAAEGVAVGDHGVWTGLSALTKNAVQEAAVTAMTFLDRASRAAPPRWR
jgi:hypothetical protein